MCNKKVISFLVKWEEFDFLGIENLVTENANFGAFWGNFFDNGGYDKIDPYQIDPNCINIWYNRPTGEKIYYQGKKVSAVDEIPPGYTLTKFPASEYLVTTTEWLASYEESMNHIIHKYYKEAETPAGYKKHSETDTGIFLIERWGEETANGYRYEFWLPLKKI